MDTPKAFVPIGGQPLLHYSLRAIAALEGIGEAVVTVPAGMERRARAEVERAGLEIAVKLVAGGAERQDSVRIALQITSAESEVVVVHDAARPFATPALFAACIDATRRADGAIAAIAVADTLKRVEGRTITATVAREGLWQAQTPQAFKRERAGPGARSRDARAMDRDRRRRIDRAMRRAGRGGRQLGHQSQDHHPGGPRNRRGARRANLCWLEKILVR